MSDPPLGGESALDRTGTRRADGFVSERARRRMVRISWLLGVVAFVLQLSLPVVLLVTGVIVMIGEVLTMPSAHVRGAALHEGRIWFAVPARDGDTRTPEPAPSQEDEPARTTTSAATSWRIESVAAAATEAATADSSASLGPFELGAGLLEQPELLAAGGKLRVIGRHEVGTVDGAELGWRQARAPAARLRMPFAYRGRPAVAAVDHGGSERDTQVVVHTYGQGVWTERGSYPLELPAGADLREIQLLEIDGALHAFVETTGDEVIHRVLAGGDADLQRWSSPWAVLDEWSAAAAAGDPVLFGLIDREQATTVAEEPTWTTHLVVAVRQGPGWRQLADQPTDRARELSALTDADGSVWLVTDGRFGGVDLRRFAAGTLGPLQTHPGAFPHRRSVSLLVLSQLAPLLLTMLVALLLARAMRHHRHGDYRIGTTAVPYASLVRRGIAQGVDTVLYLVGPAAILAPQIVEAPETFSNALVVFVCLLWCVPVMLLLSYLEGRFGRTPGKWAVGIRVVGVDLEPCGFQRALVRNLLLMIDGILHYLVGVLVIALSRSWQRLGDRAARTIVIRG
ncbi:MAG: RDD family protein [Deltaproteobacteria bacterium]|nr:RDD family protein [Deltaproteobacteria bacterium]MBW2537968.1 RDD family protein [Deltaproteobacteria bacterium]